MLQKIFLFGIHAIFVQPILKILGFLQFFNFQISMKDYRIIAFSHNDRLIG
jgi:hypothetical protein